MFDIYADKLTYVTHDTAKSYSKMISQFILYSPCVDSTDLEPFVVSKFNLPIKGGALISKLKGNALKYFKRINGFFQRVFRSEFYELNLEYSKTIKSKYKSAIHTPTIADVMSAYTDLIDKKNVSICFNFTFNVFSWN